MGDVVPFLDPAAPLQGEARDAALARLREASDALMDIALGQVFERLTTVADARRLDVSDAAEVFRQAIRRSQWAGGSP